MPTSRIRNFSIVAHIDHGKTTLSDRLLALAGTTEPEKDKTGESSSLDALPVERARGITVKAHTTSLMVRFRGEEYLLNLIDTPGHVDFTYEVSRSLRACEGAILLIDASQGIQAQTVSNFFLAFDANLEIIPILSKVDLAVADTEKCLEDVQRTFEMDPAKVLRISAKTGLNLDKVLPAVIERVPPPKGDAKAPFKAMLFDNWYETHQGVICLIRVIDGTMQTGKRVTSAGTKQTYNVMDVGVMFPNRVSTGVLYPGQVGYLVLGMRSAKEARVGDTFYEADKPVEPLPGFKPAKPMVYAGIYPAEGQPFEVFRDAMEKLTLNDASVVLTKETSQALGIGYRCGFLGLLHMDVFLQRLEEEYDVATVPAAPTVPYRVHLTDGTTVIVDNPANYPEGSRIKSTEEIWVKATILCPPEHMGNILKLCLDSRGIQKDMIYDDDKRVHMQWEIPLAEIISDFFDTLKEVSSGFATLEYEEIGFRTTEVVKLAILLNGDSVDPLSAIVHKSRATQVGRDLVEKLKAVIPKHMFVIAIQAAVGKHVLARETIAALRKDVTARCYGGDVTRKMKLLNKQKEGKKKMRQIGRVELPGDAFMAVLKKKGSGE